MLLTGEMPSTKLSADNMLRALFLFFLFVFSACGRNDKEAYYFENVGISTYRKDKCWLDDRNNLRSFVIFTPSSKGMWPLFVSDRCSLRHRGKGLRDSTLAFPDSFPVDGDGGLLKANSVTDFEITSNTSKPLPAFNEKSELYFIVAKVKKINFLDSYHIVRVEKLCKIDYDIYTFLQLGLQEKRNLNYELWCNYVGKLELRKLP